MYLQDLNEVNKLDKKIEGCILKLFGPYQKQYGVKVYYKSSKNKFESMKAVFEHIIKNSYDTQLKLSRIFEPTLYKFVNYHISGQMGTAGKTYIQECIGNILATYTHVYIPEFKLIIIDYKLK